MHPETKIVVAKTASSDRNGMTYSSFIELSFTRETSHSAAKSALISLTCAAFKWPT